MSNGTTVQIIDIVWLYRSRLAHPSGEQRGLLLVRGRRCVVTFTTARNISFLRLSKPPLTDWNLSKTNFVHFPKKCRKNILRFPNLLEYCKYCNE